MIQSMFEELKSSLLEMIDHMKSHRKEIDMDVTLYKVAYSDDEMQYFCFADSTHDAIFKLQRYLTNTIGEEEVRKLSPSEFWAESFKNRFIA